MKTNQKVPSAECRVPSAVRRGETSGPRPPAFTSRSAIQARLVTRHPSPVTRHAFTLVEILVTMTLLSLIVLVLMSVFNSTQTAFRATLTQTDLLEGGRDVLGLMKNDFESLTPSMTFSNDAVNLYIVTNRIQFQSGPAPLVQPLVGSPTSAQRTNVLETVFLLTRQNLTWTGVGYYVDPTSTNSFNPLYRFSMSTNLAADPWWLFYYFTNSVANGVFTNMSRLVDGVLHLTVRPYDLNSRWMTNGYPFLYTNVARNVTYTGPLLGEVGTSMFSNTLPAAVEINLGTLEDRIIQRAESLTGPGMATVQSNYLAQQAGKVHLFRQRIPVRNVDPSAYQ